MNPEPTLDLAYYYPNQFWYDGDWIKNLILFFDGIALLVPQYMRKRLEQWDPAIVAGLNEQGLLHVIEPEIAVDSDVSTALASAMTHVIVSGALDEMAVDGSAFAELSMSRLGYDGDFGLADMIFQELKNRNLARDTEDGVSIPMHPMLRSLILTLLSQILRSRRPISGAELSPVTDKLRLINALDEMLNLEISPARGNVVEFDLATVGVDLAPVPMGDILAFRKEHQHLYKKYSRSVRLFTGELSRMGLEERELAFEERQAELDAIAAEIRKASKKTWKKAASLGLGFVGAAWRYASNDPIGAMLAVSSAVAGFEIQKPREVEAYSYIFRASERFY